MIKNLFLAFIAYFPFAILLLAGMLGNQICTEIWSDIVNFLMY